jgi:NADH-quinone oxidoreductase subunit N
VRSQAEPGNELKSPNTEHRTSISVNFSDLIQSVIRDTVGPSFSAFRPEVAISITILVILLQRTFLPAWKSGALYLMLAGLAAALWFVLPWSGSGVGVTHTATFTGMLVADSFSIGLRFLIYLFTLLFVLFTQVSGLPKREDAAEFYVMICGALLGMSLMVSANHLIVALVGMEMASLPCYVLAGWQRNRRESSEAALKYAVFGAGAAGIMLFGMSLLAGALGSAHLPTMAARLIELVGQFKTDQASVVALGGLMMLGGLMVLVGVGFKLAAFPFHFWAPDVFEGSSAEVAAFISVASKIAALGLLVRLALAFSVVPDATVLESLAPSRQYLTLMIATLAAVTCTFGNLAAYGQTNMKRLLAYSTIAHAGYMMMPIAAAVAVAGEPGLAGTKEAISSLVVYAGIYLFMNLAAFAGVAFLRNVLGSEDLQEYSGLIRRSPGFTVCMALVMFSLLGVPPLAGFTAKFAVFKALYETGKAPIYALLMIGVLNTVLSLFYYLRVVKVMVIDPEPADRTAPEIPLFSVSGAYFFMLASFMVILFLFSGGVAKLAEQAVQSLFM